MNDDKLNRIKELQEELDCRQKVEREAEALMCQGKIHEALQLINTLDDSRMAVLISQG